jgi:ADP-heptose:LPS heptosyltransferase
MKVLVIRFSSIGDIVWTTPVIRVLKKQLPSAEIHFCTKKQYEMMMLDNPYLDKVHYLEDNLNTLITTLKEENFDVVVDLHNNLRSRWLRWKLGKKNYVYNKYGWRRWLLLTFKINKMPATHIADWYLKAIKPLKVLPDGKGLDFFIPAKWEINLQDLPALYQQGYVALVIGASEWTKRLPLEKLIELCKRLACPIILIGGKEDMEQGNLLVEAFKENTKTSVLNVCGQYNISQSASIVRQASFVVGHDTGLMHIAAAFDKKIYAIYGSTLATNLFPYTPNRVIIANDELTCRPCSKSGLSYCPKGHFKCMQDLDFEKQTFEI